MLFKGKKKLTYDELHMLEEFGLAFMEIDGKVKEIMKTKDANDIRKILDTAKRLKRNNCWSAVYRIREFIRNAGLQELKTRVPPIKMPVIEKANMQITEEQMEKIDEKEEEQ